MFIELWHRHHQPPRGCLFCIGCADVDGPHGVIVVGRPVARLLQNGFTAEVTRCATDGARNAASMLYGAAWRAAKAIGYKRLITYTLQTESGSSLRAAGWHCVGQAGGGSWHRKTRPRIDLAPITQKTLWEHVG